MRIKYKSYNFLGRDGERHDELLCSWLYYNLSTGSIEEKIKKFGELLTVMAEDFLTRNPEKLEDVVRAIDCQGTQHKLIKSENNT